MHGKDQRFGRATNFLLVLIRYALESKIWASPQIWVAFNAYWYTTEKIPGLMPKLSRARCVMNMGIWVSVKNDRCVVLVMRLVDIAREMHKMSLIMVVGGGFFGDC